MDALQKKGNRNFSQILRAALIAGVGLLFLRSGGAARAQNYTPATVQNVRVNDSYGHSVVLRWDNPPAPGMASVGGYQVAWAVNGTTAYTSKLVAAFTDKPNAFQAQPLDPAQKYTVTITPVDYLGNLGKPLSLANISPKGTYEAALRQATGNGGTGFLYLPELDPVNGRVNPLKVNNDLYNVYSGEGKGNYFDHSSAAVNNQQHWHMIANDFGTGAITSRVKGAMYLADGGTRNLVWDCDSGPFARQTWYVVLTPNKVEQFLLFPNNGDDQATGNWPLEQIQIKFSYETARITRISGGNIVARTEFNWRKNIYFNVRQVMQIALSQKGLQCYADVDYNNTMQLRGGMQANLSAWNSCYAYFTYGSYNNRKYDEMQGISATGKPMLEFNGGTMHWGNIAFDAPTGHAPPAELSYFLQPDLKSRCLTAALDVSHPLTITIPDKIPTDAVARELVFTDRNGCMPCLSGRNKLRLSVNGVLLANKKEAEAWADYPTYRWNIPAGILKQGANVIVFGQDGAIDPLGISNLHIDIHVPTTSPAVMAYTPPPAHPILDTMPDHTEMEGWTIPYVETKATSAPVSGKVFFPVTAYSVNTAHLAGNPVPFDKIWAELDGVTVWSQDTNGAGVGSMAYFGGFTLDTTQAVNGYHALVVKAHSKSGSLGYSNGTDNFNYNANFKILINNAKPNKIAPVIQNIWTMDNTVNKPQVLKPTDSFYVRPNGTYTWSFDIVTPNALQRVELYLPGWDGQYHLLRAYNPAIPTATKATANGTQYTFTDMASLWDYWPYDHNGQDKFVIWVQDAWGNVSTSTFNWSFIQSPPVVPAPATAPPTVSSFTGDPTTVKSGWACLISWNTKGAASISIDNGIGAVGETGKVCITSTQTTTYTLTATNAKGTVKKTLTITVVP